MSRIGKQPIKIPAGVSIEIHGQTVKVKSAKGELEKSFHPNMIIDHVNDEIIVKRPDETKENRSLHGLTRSLLANMVEGVTKGFEKKLEILGVGYKASPNGNKVTLTLGYSHPINFEAPKGIEISMDEEKKNVITVKGLDKQIVGEVAANIRSFRKPEPYKGKGIRYLGEYVSRKAGKAAGSK